MPSLVRKDIFHCFVCTIVQVVYFWLPINLWLVGTLALVSDPPAPGTSR